MSLTNVDTTFILSQWSFTSLVSRTIEQCNVSVNGGNSFRFNNRLKTGIKKLETATASFNRFDSEAWCIAAIFPVNICGSNGLLSNNTLFGAPDRFALSDNTNLMV